MVPSESSDMARPNGRPRKWPRLARRRYNSSGMVARAEAVSVILPVLNERDNLEPLHARLTAALKPLGRDYEIVFVDDGSTDGSWDVMKRLVASDRAVRLVRLRRNFGQTAALAAGLAHSRHPVVVTLDADLQNDPADIPRLPPGLHARHHLVCRRAHAPPGARSTACCGSSAWPWICCPSSSSATTPRAPTRSSAASGWSASASARSRSRSSPIACWCCAGSRRPRWPSS